MSSIFWLASYPKSGNTWMRAFIKNLKAADEKPVDINELHTGAIVSARAWLDDLLGVDTADLSEDEIELLRPALQAWAAAEEGEVTYHKVHDANLFNRDGERLMARSPGLGAVYIVRNPLDVATSAAGHWHCTVDQAIDRLNNVDCMLSGSRERLKPQVRQRMSSWSGHVLSWVDAFEGPLLCVRYEDMVAEPAATFGRVAAFLGLDTEPARISQALQFSSFEELSRQETLRGFKERPPKSERFFRSGRSGGWGEQLTVAQVERIVAHHGGVMQRFGYLKEGMTPG